MKKHWLALLALVLPIVSFGADSAPGATIGSDQLYYAVERQFPEKRWEGRATFTYDFSNPYLQVAGAHGALYWSMNRFLSFGLEGGAYTSSTRDSAVALAETLRRHGNRLDIATPDYGFVGVVRMTPISGLVNIFSSNVMQADVSIALRGGATRYVGLGWGPTLGTGLEVNLRAPSGWGLLTSLVLDWDRTSDSTWQSRIGVRVGPTYRF